MLRLRHVVVGSCLAIGLCVLYVRIILPATRKHYASEVWVEGRFVDHQTGEALADVLVRTVPDHEYARVSWVQKWHVQERYGSGVPMALTAFGFTSEKGEVLLKVRVTHGTRVIEPFEGVRLVWVGEPYSAFVSTETGRWLVQEGKQPCAILDLGTVAVRRPPP